MTDTVSGSVNDMPSGEQFAVIRDRDAWPTIRGFSYQVDLTIMRWIQLRDDEALELERGEDIDLITRAITARVQADANRLLEQVKHREGRISLRSDSAKEALANFHDHLSANPGLRLRFRFTTNAGVAREQNSPVPGKLPGIQAWGLLGTGKIDPVQEKEVVTGLRGLLTSSSRPNSLSETQWNGFQAWVGTASDVQFKAFAESFEWATLTPDSPTLRPEICQMLVSLGAAQTNAGAEATYRRLFYAVFTCLSTSGVKRLTRATLITELTSPAIADREVVGRLARLHDALAARLDEHDARLQQLAGVLAVTAGRVDELARQTGILAALDPRAEIPPPLSEPVMIMRGSPRSETVAALVGSAPRPLVVALHGAAGVGKTQLALLISHDLGERRVWVRFRGLNVREASHHLWIAVNAMVTESEGILPDGGDWEAACLAAATEAEVVILDDVPYFRDGDAFGSRLLPFIRALVASGGSAVLTSTSPFGGLDGVVPNSALVRSPVPSFTTAEVRDVLRAYGAPEELVQSNVATLVVGITKGHPTLLHAVAQFLSAQGWSLSNDVLTSLFMSTYAEPVNRETVRTLLEGVADEATRELLYRLVLVGAEFGMDEVSVLSEVPPPLGFRRERFTTLVGPWVEARASDRYVVSPLVSVLGGGDLSGEVRRGCHAVLARRIVSRKKIGELEFSAALTHFIGAEDVNSAGLLVIQALHSVYVAPGDVASRSLITRVWRDMPLPAGMDPGLRLQVRAYQAVLAPRQHEAPDRAITAIEQILAENPPPPDWSIFAASLLVVVNFAIEGAALAAPFARRVLTMWPAMEASFGRVGLELEGPRFGGISGLVWVLSGGVNSKQDLDAWLSTVAELPEAVRSQAFSSVLGSHGATILANRPVLWEYNKPPTQRNWLRLADELKGLEATARMMKAAPLVVAAIAARLSCLVEAGRDFTDVSLDAEKAMKEFGGIADHVFLIAKSLGLAALDANLSAAAVEWLRRADAADGELHGLDRVHVKIRLAQLTHSTDAPSSVRYAEQAVALARHVPRDLSMAIQSTTEFGPRTGDILLPQALGELALVRWTVGDRFGAGRTLIEMIEELVAGRADHDNKWKRVFVTAGHLSGYLTAVLTTGAPPTATSDGQEYVPPKPGMLLTPSEEAANLYRPEKLAFIGVHALQIADSIGDDDTAVRWALRAAASLKDSGLWLAATLPLRKLAQHAVSTDRYAEAIGHAIDVAAAYMLARRAGLESADMFGPTPPPREVVGSRTGDDEAWSDIDAMALTEVVLPAFLRVATTHGTEGSRSPGVAVLLRDACLDQARSDELPLVDAPVGDDVWAEAARLCEDVFIRGIELRTLLTRVGEYKSRGGNTNQTLAVIAYVGASLHPRASAAERASLHSAIGSYVQDGLGRTFRMYERIALPFFEAFWQTVFNEGRFNFRAPALVGSRITEAIADPSGVRLQHLLRAVVDGLGVAVDMRAREWMNADPKQDK